MSGSGVFKAFGCLTSIVIGAACMKLGFDAAQGLLRVHFDGQESTVGFVLVGVGVGVIALASQVLTRVILEPFSPYSPMHTWKSMSPDLKKRVAVASLNKQYEVPLGTDAAFEALRLTSVKKEQNLVLLRDALGTRIRISADMYAYCRKYHRDYDTPKKRDTRNDVANASDAGIIVGGASRSVPPYVAVTPPSAPEVTAILPTRSPGRHAGTGQVSD